MHMDQWPNLVAMFFDQAKNLGDDPFLWAKRDSAWQSWSWNQLARDVRALAGHLRAKGLEDGDRVVLVADNSPEWAIADFAIMAAGGVTVPAYTTNTARDQVHILNDSGARMAIASTAALSRPVLEAAGAAPELRHMVTIEAVSVEPPSHVSLAGWGYALRGDEADDGFEARIAAIPRDGLACLIYTSGTGGAPKGVMLSHRAMMANCLGAYDLLYEFGLDHEIFLSFLPLSHSYEHSCGLMFPASIGAEIYYAEGIEALSGNLAEVRPTIMTSVPRLYEVMRGRILQGVKRAGGLKEKMFTTAAKLGRKQYEAPGSLGPIERLVDGVVDRLVRNKVRDRFGGRLKAMVSGGAPLNYDVGIFFTALGLRLLQGYGQTEAAPVISCNPPQKIKLETVGPPLTDVEVKIAEDGEILVRGPLLMDGYWNLPDVTAETLRDGWLHTGDVGEFDDDGYIRITDRKKDIIVLSGGDNVSPQRIEGILELEAEVGQAMVYGDQRAHLVALVVPSEDLLGGDPEAVREAIGAAVTRANAGLSVIERIKRYAVADAAFTTDNEMMTPTMKIRRHKILETYGTQLEGLY